MDYLMSFFCHYRLDLRSFLNDYKKPAAAEFTMHTKVALCYGYAELFAELCRYIFMEVSEILSSEDKQP